VSLRRKADSNMALTRQYLLFSYGVSLLLAGQTFSTSPKLEPVSGFDLNRYLGKWYEIARLPTWFEKDLVNVIATYSLLSEGKVKVVNEGYKKTRSGKHKVAIGKARFAKSPDKGYLKVSFFGPFYADYMIVELDPGYKYAMVASSRKYLWILSREPKMDSIVLDKLVKRAQELGFDTSRLYSTPQDL
jgi:apolipoprotein D and lipocalin family protein